MVQNSIENNCHYKLYLDILKDTELTIKTMNVSMRGRNSDKRFEAIKTYSSKLQV